MDYDVIIIGAGPGGAIAGKTVAENGLRTLILERGVVPGDKNASGCALSPKCWRDFDFMHEMDIPQRVSKMATMHFIDENLREDSFIGVSASQFGSYKEAREFLTVNVYRSQLDPWLASLATDVGVELKTSTLATDVLKDKTGMVIGVVTDKGKKLKADVVIAADGAISMMAKQ